MAYLLVEYSPLLDPVPGIWRDQFVNAMALGGLYALIAIGYTMVYGVLQMINFAHGEIFMLGAFAGLWVFNQMEDIADSASAVVMLCAMVAAMGMSGLSALVLERLAYRPLRRAPRLVPLISAIGASIFISQLVNVIVRGQPQPVPRVSSGKLRNRRDGDLLQRPFLDSDVLCLHARALLLHPLHEDG
ncbi:MAG: branched-chain amino acid ABC transporter permease [Dehalococcoidia bacterium]